jgi:hypothetical protein
MSMLVGLDDLTLAGLYHPWRYWNALQVLVPIQRNFFSVNCTVQVLSAGITKNVLNLRSSGTLVL